MSSSDSGLVSIRSTNSERWELYRAMDIREKLSNGQAYLVPGRLMKGPPRGNFPPGIQSRMVEIRLSINNWFLCYAHQYVRADGSPYTGPDPKMLRIDQVVLTQ